MIHYGDSVPAEYSQREQHMLNTQGLEVQKRQAEMSPNEAAAYAAKQKEEARRKQHDMFLISTYPSVKEIENVRDTRLDQINGQISRGRGVHLQPHHARRWTQAARADVRALQHQAGRAPHARRSRRRDGSRAERAAHAEFRAGRSVAPNCSRVMDQFDADIKRFKELRTSAAARVNDANRPKKQ